MTKTNVMRLLEAAGIAYRTAEYEYDESNLSGLHAAEQVGMAPEQVFKTLVTRGDKNGINVFCIPVDMELDLKKAAVVSKNKKVEMTHMRNIPVRLLQREEGDILRWYCREYLYRLYTVYSWVLFLRWRYPNYKYTNLPCEEVLHTEDTGG